MLTVSDNARTNMLIERYGLGTLDGFSHSNGMSRTQVNNYVDCTGPDNALTLADADRLYEGLVNGALLTSANAQTLFAAMPGQSLNQDDSNTLHNIQAIVNQQGCSTLNT